MNEHCPSCGTYQKIDPNDNIGECEACKNTYEVVLCYSEHQDKEWYMIIWEFESPQNI